MYTGSQPGQGHQHPTDLVAYDGHVVQRFKDGHIAESGHEDKGKDLQVAKEMECEDLCHALTERNSGLLQKEVYNHSRSCRTREAGVRQR
jgi:hypothetical protein